MGWDLKKINVAQVASIEIYKKERISGFEYKEELKLFSIILTIEGFYNSGKHIPNEIIIKEGCIIEGKHVYRKPHIIIRTSDGMGHRINFETESKLETYLYKNEFKEITFIGD